MKLNLSVFFSLCILLLLENLYAQPIQDTPVVYARKWSRNKDRKIVYSDWMAFKTQTVANLELPAIPDLKCTQFGGSLSYTFPATGFFRIEKNENKTWVVDPKGHPMIIAGLNSVRKGTSPQHQEAFQQKYHVDPNWMKDVKTIMDSTRFNMIGSWSDTGAIRAYNAAHPDKGIVYTIQLSILSGFAQEERRIHPEKKDWPLLAFLFEKEFDAYALERCRILKPYQQDPWLAGLFTDNELPFQNNLIKEFLAIRNPENAARKVALKALQELPFSDTSQLEKDVQQRFAGYVAETYFNKVRHAIRASDTHHLIMGSRLHSSAKSNPYILSACEKFQDIVSINYYGNWMPTEKEVNLWKSLSIPFMITEFYTKAEDSGLPNISGAGWLVKSQKDRAGFYQNFCLSLLSIPNCVGWHWFRYQDNDPSDPLSDPSNNDSNKGIVDNKYNPYTILLRSMKELNSVAFFLANNSIR